MYSWWRIWCCYKTGSERENDGRFWCIFSVTFVTDIESKMPVIVFEFVSESLSTYKERWVGLISHQIITCMKHAMKKYKTEWYVIWDELERDKIIVRLFKHSWGNDEIREGKPQMKEVETRFRTTHEVVKRFWRLLMILSTFYVQRIRTKHLEIGKMDLYTIHGGQ